MRHEDDGADGHFHNNVVGGFEYYKTIFKTGNEYFEGIINIANTTKGEKLHDITKIQNITQDIMSSYGKNPKSQFLRNVSMVRIPQESERNNGTDGIYDRFFQTFMSGMQDQPRPSRFHIGRMELIPKGKMLSHTMRLRLADAVAEGTTVTDCGSIHCECPTGNVSYPICSYSFGAGRAAAASDKL